MSNLSPCSFSNNKYEFSDRRSQVDFLRSRINLLEGCDKAIMSLYLDNGVSLSQLAGLLGKSPSTISRRVRKLSKRLVKAGSVECITKDHALDHIEQKITDDYFVTGLSMRRIATKRKLSYYSVRQTIIKLRYLISYNK